MISALYHLLNLDHQFTVSRNSEQFRRICAHRGQITHRHLPEVDVDVKTRDVKLFLQKDVNSWNRMPDQPDWLISLQFYLRGFVNTECD